jgi:ADP-ribose pyrophosphatase YjhB (NUDIX family)
MVFFILRVFPVINLEGRTVESTEISNLSVAVSYNNILFAFSKIFSIIRGRMSYWKTLRARFGRSQLILPGVAGAVVKNGKILLVHHRELDKWQVPGGFMELDESAEKAVEREVHEELGLRMRADKLLSILSSPRWNITYPNGDHVQQLIFFFLMKGAIKEDSIRLEPGELNNYGFYDPLRLPANTLPCCRAKVRHWRAFKGSTIVD